VIRHFPAPDADERVVARSCAGLQPSSPACRTVTIALLGCGNVGSAVARLLREPRVSSSHSRRVALQLVRVLVRDSAKLRDGVHASLLTCDFDDVLRDRPDVIIETLGGRDPAATVVSRALERGIHVVSANKTLIAHEGPRLDDIADRAGVSLAYEASVGAAVPILAALRQRVGEPVARLRAILNGTCNFVLTRMSDTGGTLESGLRDAIALGLAEPDPSADICGRDSAEKLCILARVAGFSEVTPTDIATRGIEAITPRDVQAARELGCVIRLVADLDASKYGGPPELSVSPAFVPITHPLAKARGAENVFVLDQEHAGRLVLHGEGAGPWPTAAAMLGDVLRIVGAGAANPPSHAVPCVGESRRATSFVRLPREHAAVNRLHVAASQVHLRRDTVELVVGRAEAADVRDGFAATMVDE
jgi:homoserine dehydrogenase